MNELDVLAGVGGANLYVRLYTNAVVIDADVTLSALVEATWSGYTAYNSALWSAPVIDTNGDAVILSPVLVFPGPTVLPGQTVYGFFVTIGDGADALLWMVEALPTPRLMQFPTDQLPLRVEARLRYPAA